MLDHPSLQIIRARSSTYLRSRVVVLLCLMVVFISNTVTIIVAPEHFVDGALVCPLCPPYPQLDRRYDGYRRCRE